jgi:UDP-N-acetylmuramoyl-tripeptide--D-alanyl-D-alanine ligase
MELQGLAQHYRKMMGVSVLAITGSNGKTTTKELIAAIMSKKLRVHYTRGKPEQRNRIASYYSFRS